MGFYRNNIGRTQQVLRIALGTAGVVAGMAFLPAPWNWLAAISGIGTALTGFVGWCPACAVAGINTGKRT
ncbi:MAG TPA: DUF2892 domain-containing protein [Ensifer sp.]|nr:DUF2892 domain-containing protein [Ensifer sp.]